MSPEAGKAAERPRSKLHKFEVSTRSRVEFVDVTDRVERFLSESSVRNGICLVFTPHTTSAILINENADPTLHTDFDNFLKGLAPRREDYSHNDGNCDSHLKSALIGPSKTLPVENGRLVLGTWQGIFLCEFDGPRHRQVTVKIVSD